MSPITVLVGTFLIWIAVKGELSTYAGFATTKNTTGSSPASSTGGGALAPTSSSATPPATTSFGGASLQTTLNNYGVSLSA